MSLSASAIRFCNSSSVKPFSSTIFDTVAKKALRMTSSPGYFHSVMIVVLKALRQKGESDPKQRREPAARQKERGQTEQNEIEGQETTELLELGRWWEFNVGWKWEHRVRPPLGYAGRAALL
jgi:hypothetical protein